MAPLPSLEFLKFMGEMSVVTETLSKLFGAEFLSTDVKVFVDTGRPIDRAIKKAVKNYLGGNKIHARYEKERLWRLAQEIEIVRTYDEALFNHFRDELTNAPNDIAHFYGQRFEVYVAASLIQKKVDLIKRESPDFQINLSSDSIYIECASRRTPERITDPIPKIVGKIRSKSKYHYANRSTALFLDITNIRHRSKQPIDRSDLDKSVSEVQGDSKYGAVLLFTAAYDQDRGRIASVYNRYIHQEAIPQLISALDSWYPIDSSSGNISLAAIPTER